MADLKFERSGSGYVDVQTLGGHRVEAHIKRVKESGDRIKAEMAIMVDGHGIARNSPTLTSVSGLDAWWRKLSRRLPTPDWGIDWEAYIEGLAGRVIDAHREGESEIIIGNVEVPVNVRWQIEPMLLADQPNVLFGPGGSGKSTLSVWLAVLMDTHHVDTQHGLAVSPGRVLYLDYETDSIEIAGRVRDLQAGMGLNGHKSNIVYRRCTQSLASEADLIKDLVDRYEIQMTIVDSLGLATGGGLDEAESVLNYFAALRWIGGTSLTITHTNKENKIFGSVYTLNCGRSIWECKKSGEEGDKRIDVGIWHRKVNLVGKQRPRAFGVTFDEGAVTVVARDPMETEVVAENFSISELVYMIVAKEGPIGRERMAERVAIYRNEPAEKISGAVATAISRHIKAKRIVDVGGELGIQQKMDDSGGDSWEI
jgi:energy-coupling factor transporter ATP-binding protein EcfA2